MRSVLTVIMRSAFCISALAVLSLLHSASAALPPGFEDEIYCPPEFCLRDRPENEGMAGPMSMFYECFNPTTSKVEAIQTWGSNEGDGAKQKLESDGFHRKRCAQQMQGMVTQLMDGLQKGTKVPSVLPSTVASTRPVP